MLILANKKLRTTLLILLVSAASLSIYQGVSNALKHSQDLQWSPSVLFWHGVDPYSESLSGNEKDRIILSQYPNYLHHFYIMLWPFAQMEFDDAKKACVSLNIVLAFLALLLLKKHASLGWSEFTVISSLFFMSTPFRNCLGNGQASIFVLFFLLLYWFSSRPVKGLWLAAGIVKYSFAPVFIIRAALNKEASLIVATVIVVAGVLFFGFHTSSLSLMLPFQPLLVATENTSPGAADIMTVMRYDFSLSFVLAAAISISLALLVAILVREAASDLLSLSIVSLASLLFFQHLGYDYVFLLPALVLLCSQSRSSRLSRYSYVINAVTIFVFLFLDKN